MLIQPSDTDIMLKVINIISHFSMLCDSNFGIKIQLSKTESNCLSIKTCTHNCDFSCNSCKESYQHACFLQYIFFSTQFLLLSFIYLFIYIFADDLYPSLKNIYISFILHSSLKQKRMVFKNS